MLFLSILVTVILINIPERHADFACPELVQIMAGSTATVSCNITENEIVKVYWYMGDTTSTSPILRLENKRPGGTEYGKGHYNITRSGEMVIINAEIMHEAVYTTLVFLHDDISESKKIQVNVTVSPWPSCPVIDVCIPCKECSLAVSGTGKLTCSVNGALPMIHLKWVIKTQNGISILPHSPNVVKDVPSSTWNSSVQLSYGTSHCFQEANIQCVAEDPFNLLEYSVTLVRIYTANCTDDNPESDRTGPVKVMTILIVCVVMVTTSILLILIFAHRSRTKIASQKVQTFTSNLKKQYRACPLLSPSARGKDFDDLGMYVACQCKVTYTNGDTSVISTDKLLKSNLFMDEKRVLLTGGINYWECVFTKQLLLNWIQNDQSDFILLFTARREVESSMKLRDVLHEETSIKGDIIAKCVRKKKCILLLHGLADITYDRKDTNQDQSERSTADLTFSELFRRSGDKANTQLKVWITSWRKDYSGDDLGERFTKIQVSHVDQRQFDELIENVSKQSINLREKSTTEEAVSDKVVHNVKTESAKKCKNESNSMYSIITYHKEKQDFQFTGKQSKVSEPESVKLLPHGEINEECNSMTIPKKLHLAKEFLQTSQFYTEFRENPIALSVIAHLVINEYVLPTTNSVEGNTPTKEDIVCKLVNYLQQSYFEKNNNKKPADFHIDQSLGMLALHLIDKHSNCFDTRTSVLSDCVGDFNLAIEMSLLQHSTHISDSQQSGQITELSLQHHVGFSSVYLTNYFAAKYLVQAKLNDRETLHKYERNFAMFEFMIHFVESPIKHLLGVFHKFKSDDDVIDYLHKWGNKGGVKKVMTELEGRDVRISRLDDTEHQKAFATFCENCCKMKIKLKSISIIRTVSLNFMTSLDLPDVDELTFYKMKINKELFLLTLEWLAEKEIVLRFLDCKVPEEFGEDFHKKFPDPRLFKVKTKLQPNETNNSISVLHYETGAWAKEKE